MEGKCCSSIESIRSQKEEKTNTTTKTRQRITLHQASVHERNTLTKMARKIFVCGIISCKFASIASGFTLVDFPKRMSHVHGRGVGVARQDVRLLVSTTTTTTTTTTIATPLPRYTTTTTNDNEQKQQQATTSKHNNDGEHPLTEKKKTEHIDQTLKKEQTLGKIKYLIHRGRSAAMIKRAPSIAGIGFCRGWDEGATHAFTKAVQQLVELNPILSGHVYKSNRSGRSELRVQAGTFPSDSFVNVVQAPPTLQQEDVFDSETTTATTTTPNTLLDIVTTHCFPLLQESELTSDQIKKRLPLFSTTVIVLPNNHAVYAMKLSHAIGDGVTFMMLLKQLSLLMSGKNQDDLHPIDWNHPLKETHELFPEEFSSPHDIECMYGAPFMVGAVKNVMRQEIAKHTLSSSSSPPPPQSRSVGVLLLDKQKVNEKKRQLRTELDCRDISANDILTAALCQSNQSSDLFVFTENVRDGQTIAHDVGGNFLVEIPVDRQTACHPDQLRRAVTASQRRRRHKEDDDKNEEVAVAATTTIAPARLPVKPFLDGRVARITSLATIPASLVYEGTEQLCTVPYLSFLSKIPLDTALIFRFDARCWGVVHNFAKLSPGPLLKELMVHDDEDDDGRTNIGTTKGTGEGS